MHPSPWLIKYLITQGKWFLFQLSSFLVSSSLCVYVLFPSFLLCPCHLKSPILKSNGPSLQLFGRKIPFPPLPVVLGTPHLCFPAQCILFHGQLSVVAFWVMVFTLCSSSVFCKFSSLLFLVSFYYVLVFICPQFTLVGS